MLYLEQLLTTGGGWQDQVGGLMGGVHLGLSEAKLPLTVDVVDLKPSADLIQKINDRIVLIYTGKTRLARNLLQVWICHFDKFMLCSQIYRENTTGN